MKNFNLLKPYSVTLVFILLLSSLNLFSQTYNDADDLADAVNDATTGGVFIVEDGTYNDFEATFEIMATESNPILIKAATVGGVTLTGESHFTFKKSAYITLEGFVIDGEGDDTLVKLEGCHNIRITRNVFELQTEESIKWVYIGGVYNDNTLPFEFPSHHNRIDHNTFQNKTTPGHYITIDGTTDSDDLAYQSQYDRIDHNYFKNNSPRAVNEQESIRVGWSEMAMSSGFTTVEFNLFEDCDGDPEIVSVKSSDNFIRHNTFISSYGTLSLRHGNRNRVEGNYFFGNGKPVGTSPDGATLYTGGIRIYGTDHVIINNYMEGLNGTRWDAPIALTMGDAIDGQSSDLTKHFRAERVTIAYNTLVNNTHGIEIGYDNNDNYNTDLSDITIANNLITGSENAMVEIVDTDNDQGDNITWINNLMNPTGTAQLLTGATTTSFDSNEVVDEDPNLVLNTSITYSNTAGVWKSSDTTPLYTNGVALEAVEEDIDGQPRPVISNPGADFFSAESIRYTPLTTADVGPDSPEGDPGDTDYLTLTSIGNYLAEGESQDVAVASNLDWTVDENESWISISPTTGTGNGVITITVNENIAFSSRTATVTVTADDITRTINIIQDAAVLTNLINDGTPSDPVTVTASTEQVGGGYSNYATNTLDKDFATRWSGEGVGAELIYDLGGTYQLDLINIATLATKTYLYEIWVSMDDANYTFISSVQSNTTGNFESFVVTNEAQYVKIVGIGQLEGSVWNSMTEIEFYGDSTLSIDDLEFNKNILVYPNPVKNNLNIKILNENRVEMIKLYSIEGKLIIEQKLDVPKYDVRMNLSTLSAGIYILNLSGKQGINFSKLIVVSD